ncbi:rCG49045 [Rattus norvegicus]|uniref:RCG49045 n=1 Tax=Rattus norvegicus TaxID=10116 RepID=A6IGW0_RAT|nr:rCG49045 [Rattus norvegicus]
MNSQDRPNHGTDFTSDIRQFSLSISLTQTCCRVQ